MSTKSAARATRRVLTPEVIATALTRAQRLLLATAALHGRADVVPSQRAMVRRLASAGLLEAPEFGRWESFVVPTVLGRVVGRIASLGSRVDP